MPSTPLKHTGAHDWPGGTGGENIAGCALVGGICKGASAQLGIARRRAYRRRHRIGGIIVMRNRVNINHSNKAHHAATLAAAGGGICGILSAGTLLRGTSAHASARGCVGATPRGARVLASLHLAYTSLAAYFILRVNSLAKNVNWPLCVA